MSKDYGLSEGADPCDESCSMAMQLKLIGEGKSVLDVGCYEGALARELVRRGCVVTGVELDERAAGMARETCESVLVGDVEQMDLADELSGRRFDVGLFGDVLEHLKDPARVLRQVRGLLAPDGYVVLSVPNIAHASIRLMLLEGRFEYEEFGILDDTHLKYFTRDSIADLLESCGFFIEDIYWTDKPVPESRIREVLDPLGLSDLHRVVEAFSDWEASAFQWVVKAFPAGEEDRVRKLSEEKVRAEKRVRELEKSAERLEEAMRGLKSLEEERDSLLDIKASLEAQLGKSGEYAKRLEDMIEIKDKRIDEL